MSNGVKIPFSEGLQHLGNRFLLWKTERHIETTILTDLCIVCKHAGLGGKSSCCLPLSYHDRHSRRSQAQYNASISQWAGNILLGRNRRISWEAQEMYTTRCAWIQQHQKTGFRGKSNWLHFLLSEGSSHFQSSRNANQAHNGLSHFYKVSCYV